MTMELIENFPFTKEMRGILSEELDKNIAELVTSFGKLRKLDEYAKNRAVASSDFKEELEKCAIDNPDKALYRFISKERPELALGEIFMDKVDPIIGLVEYDNDISTLEVYLKKDVEQYYNLNKFYVIPEAIETFKEFLDYIIIQ